MRQIPNYSEWFHSILACAPHPWQATIGDTEACEDLLLRIPTGFGKTAGVVLPWLYHRVVRHDRAWPTRLAFVLPMRVLVEQTVSHVRRWLDKGGLAQVGVEVLMGGEEIGDWARTPESPMVLVGTQDMLLSRALNRGYGSGRARWPVDFGLLNHDTLWVLDEVQLMDVGLTTGTQLAVFRQQDASEHGALRPCHTWWMSATLQPAWLESVDSRPLLAGLRERMVVIPEEARNGGLWEVTKRLGRRGDVTTPAEIAHIVTEQHEAATLTLVVVNRVSTACDVFDTLYKHYGRKGTLATSNAPDLRLVHGRFRGEEKQHWAEEFLRRELQTRAGGMPESGRIVVATQVVEAGVDVSAATLISELAPWSSLVQRFGRCARYSEERGVIVVVGAAPDDDKASVPYTATALGAAAHGLDMLSAAESGNAAPAALERFEATLAREQPDFLARLYPYVPDIVLRRQVVHELFDTSPDLSGADLDVSQFIRSGDDERDVTLFWREIETVRSKGDDRWPWEIRRSAIERPERRELCPAPLGEVRKWLAGGVPAWVFDYQSGCWERLRSDRRLVAGQQVLLAAGSGGYSLTRGFDPKSKKRVEPVALASDDSSSTGAVDDDVVRSHLRARDLHASSLADSTEDNDSLSQAQQWKTVAFHGLEVATAASELAQALELPSSFAHVLHLAGRWHDVGKVHDVFQNAITAGARAAGGELARRRDLAKAPREAWERYNRPGFRHEIASALGLFELLRRTDPDHLALLGPHRATLELLVSSGLTNVRVIADDPPLSEAEKTLGEELARLSAEEFDLVAWLVCSHHGKVRCSWSSTPKDQEAGYGHIHGVGEGDVLGGFELMNADGVRQVVSCLTLRIDELAALGLGTTYGASWRERVERQLVRWGPFQLAFLEGLFRAADRRASALDTSEVVE